MSTKRCPFCQEELPESATFCPACFCELHKAKETATVGFSAARRRKFLVVGLFCVLIFLLILGGFLLLKDAQTGSAPTVSPTLYKPNSAMPSSQITATTSTAGTPEVSATASISAAFEATATVQVTGTPEASERLTPSFISSTPVLTASPTPTVQSTTPVWTVTPTNTPTLSPTKTPTATPEIDESVWSYTISNNKATVKAYYGGEKEVLIPTTLGGATVFEIGSQAFFGNVSAEHLYIPNSVQIIGESAFSNCHNLISVYMEDSVTTLGDSAFCHCEDLETVRLSDKIQTIPNSCFSLCRKLHTLNMPKSLVVIRPDALSDTAIKSLSLPATLTTLPNMFGSYMPDLESIEVAEENSTFWSKDGVLFRKSTLNNSSDLFTYPGGKKDTIYTMPANVTQVWANAFCRNPYLREVTLSPSLNNILSFAFSECSALTTVKSYNNIRLIQDAAFRNCTNLTSIYLSSHITSISENAFQNCLNLTLTVTEGSYSHTYAIDNKIPYILEQ